MKSVGKTLAAELAGTAALMFAVNSASLMAQRLAPGNEAAGLLASSGSTAVALYVLMTLGMRGGAGYLNPLAPPIAWLRGELGLSELLPLTGLLVLVQGIGALAGAWTANELLAVNPGDPSARSAAGLGRLISEGAVAAGVVVIRFIAPQGKIAMLVAIFSAVAYWCTTSTAFGNPAAVLARLYVDGPMGIAPGEAVDVFLAQLIGAFFGACCAWALGSGRVKEEDRDHHV